MNESIVKCTHKYKSPARGMKKECVIKIEYNVETLGKLARLPFELVAGDFKVFFNSFQNNETFIYGKELILGMSPQKQIIVVEDGHDHLKLLRSLESAFIAVNEKGDELINKLEDMKWHLVNIY